MTEIAAPRITDRWPSWAPWALLALGVLAASVSAILIRYAGEAHPFAISFWRCAAGALVLAPFSRFRKVAAVPSARRSSIVAGLFLAVHFATWIASLELTTVAEAVLLVSLSPIFIALVSPRFLGERVGGQAWAGIVLAVSGGAIVGGLDFGGSIDGNVLALIGGATAGGYVVAGQLARRQLGIIDYAVLTYGVAAIVLLPLCLIRGVEMFAYSGQTWLAIAGLIVGPQLLGHTVINLVLSDIDATTVSVSIMAEPLVAIALAYALFDETPHVLVYPGGAAILAGVLLVSLARRTPEIAPE